MSTKYTKEQLLKFSNDEMSERILGRAVDIRLRNGRTTQLCVNDLQGFDTENRVFYTRTDIRILLQEVDYIEVFI